MQDHQIGSVMGELERGGVPKVIQDAVLQLLLLSERTPIEKIDLNITYTVQRKES